jgi:hypothetical protein
MKSVQGISEKMNYAQSRIETAMVIRPDPIAF